jgi:hypothetical protein
MSANRVTTLAGAIATYVKPGMTGALEGFGHLVPSAAAHEIIRQRIQDLTVCRMSCDMMIDQYPSPVQGYYDRDDAFFREWSEMGRAEGAVGRWLDSYVWATADHEEIPGPHRTGGAQEVAGRRRAVGTGELRAAPAAGHLPTGRLPARP